MSTKERLTQLDKERDELIKQLPWYKKFYRRFMTGDSFVAWNLSSFTSWLTAFPAGLAASSFIPGLAAKYPVAWGVATKAVAVIQNSWAAVTAFFVGMAKVAFSVAN